MKKLPELVRGANGTHTRIAQALLTVAGHKLTQDGDFGARTEAAVKAEQRKAGIEADGIVGLSTWAVLLRV